jgi:uncharacterized phage infection (PIP) family protein YhgE
MNLQELGKTTAKLSGDLAAGFKAVDTTFAALWKGSNKGPTDAQLKAAVDALDDLDVQLKQVGGKFSDLRDSLEEAAEEEAEQVKDLAEAEKEVDQLTGRTVFQSKYLKAFLRYCRKERCAENPEFIQAVVSRKNPLEIYLDFIGKDADQQVNLPDGEVKDLTEKFSTANVQPKLSWFDDSVETIYRLLDKDTMIRFRLKLKADLAERTKKK